MFLLWSVASFFSAAGQGPDQVDGGGEELPIGVEAESKPVTIGDLLSACPDASIPPIRQHMFQYAEEVLEFTDKIGNLLPAKIENIEDKPFIFVGGSMFDASALLRISINTKTSILTASFSQAITIYDRDNRLFYIQREDFPRIVLWRPGTA